MSIIGLKDIDIYFLNFLDFESILNLESVSRKNKIFFQELPLYQEIVEYIKLVSKNNIIYDTINLISKHSYIRISEY
jgi:hypothetical protein